MNSRTRVATALNHEEPDRIPIDMGSTIITSITKQPYCDLRRELDLPEEKTKIFDHVQQLPFVNEDLLKILDIDFRMIQLGPAATINQNYREEGDYYTFCDRWGAKLFMPKKDGYYFDWREFPIKEANLAELKKYRWPEPDPEDMVKELAEVAKNLYETTDYCIVGSAIIGGGIFEQPARMMGMEPFLMALVSNPRFCKELMDKIVEIYIASCERYLKYISPYVQVFAFWDDFAGQTGSIVSPKLYRKMIKPREKQIIDYIKKNTKAKIFFHSCGAVRDFIPDLIEIGADILNPVQVSANGMDTKQLKREFGKDIVFWGGGVDTQRILPYGTVDEVKDEVKRRIDDLACGGGFVFAPVHNIQPNTPPANIIAAYETAYEYGRY